MVLQIFQEFHIFRFLSDLFVFEPFVKIGSDSFKKYLLSLVIEVVHECLACLECSFLAKWHYDMFCALSIASITDLHHDSLPEVLTVVLVGQGDVDILLPEQSKEDSDNHRMDVTVWVWLTHLLIQLFSPLDPVDLFPSFDFLQQPTNRHGKHLSVFWMRQSTYPNR